MASRDLFTGFKKLDFRPSSGPTTAFKTVTRQSDGTKSKTRVGFTAPKAAAVMEPAASPAAKSVTTATVTPKPKPQPNTAAKGLATKMLMGAIAPQKAAPPKASASSGGTLNSFMKQMIGGREKKSLPTMSRAPGQSLAQAGLMTGLMGKTPSRKK
jgi:hypothetical protein